MQDSVLNYECNLNNFKIMKRVFYILILVLAINFVTPNSQYLSQRLRHIIEYNYEDKRKRLKGNDAARNRAVLYLRLHLIKIRIEQINFSYSPLLVLSPTTF